MSIKTGRNPIVGKIAAKAPEKVDVAALKKNPALMLPYFIGGAEALQAGIEKRVAPLIDKGRTPTELAHLVPVLRAAHGRLETAVKTFEKLVDQLESEVIPEAFERADMTNCTIEGELGKFRVGVSVILRAALKGDKGEPVMVWRVGKGDAMLGEFTSPKDAREFIEATYPGKKAEGVVIVAYEVPVKYAAKVWLRTHDLGDLITETVNAGTLSATGKRLLDEGKELPEAYFSTYYQKSVSLNKA